MKTIAIEEHFKIPAIIEANSGGAQEKAFKLFGSTGIYSTGEDGEVPAGSLDIGLKRLAAMDASGIDVQVLSLNQPATENLEPELAVKLAAMANDKIAAAVTAHPTRLGGFATLPMPNPKASAAELERMVTNHGFLGAMIHGHIRGRYLDHQFFWPVFEMAEKLDVPIYLHPKRPPHAVEDACYGGRTMSKWEAEKAESRRSIGGHMCAHPVGLVDNIGKCKSHALSRTPSYCRTSPRDKARCRSA